MDWRRDTDMEQEYTELMQRVHRKSFIVLIFRAVQGLSSARQCGKRSAYNLLKMVFSKTRWKYSMLDVDMIMMFEKFDRKKARQAGYESSLMIIDEDAFAKED